MSKGSGDRGNKKKRDAAPYWAELERRKRNGEVPSWAGMKKAEGRK